MTEPRPSLDRGYFEDLYAGSADPWRFRTSPYEDRKYTATLDILPRADYGRALEVGCSIGVFTRRLASRCRSVLALDISSIALAEAARANADLGHVTFRQATLPRDFPEGSFDLVVLSEVLYYLSRADLDAVAALCTGALSPRGSIVLCHWLGATDYPLSGDEAADAFIAAAAPRWRVAAVRREPEYRLDLLLAAD